MPSLSDTTVTPVVVFGAGGFIGGAIVRALQSDPAFRPMPVVSADADLADPDAVDELTDTLPEGAVWIVAAAKNPDCGAPDREILLTNIAMAENLAAQLGKAPPRALVFLSSIDVYGRNRLELPLTEQSPLLPENGYAISKVVAEATFAQACDELGVPLTVLRLPGIYGPGDPHRGPVRAFLDAAAQQEPATLFGDGGQTRDLVYLDDLARLVASICACNTPGTFNVATGTATTLNEILAIIQADLAPDLQIIHEGDAQAVNIAFDTTHFAQHFPDFRFTPLRDGLRATWEQRTAKAGVA